MTDDATLAALFRYAFSPWILNRGTNGELTHQGLKFGCLLDVLHDGLLTPYI